MIFRDLRLVHRKLTFRFYTLLEICTKKVYNKSDNKVLTCARKRRKAYGTICICR